MRLNPSKDERRIILATFANMGDLLLISDLGPERHVRKIVRVRVGREWLELTVDAKVVAGEPEMLAVEW